MNNFLMLLAGVSFLIACVVIYYFVKNIKNNHAYQLILRNTQIVTTNPISSKIWDDKIIDEDSSIFRIYYRIGWVEYLEQFSEQINKMVEKGYITCQIDKYASEQNNTIKFYCINPPKNVQEFEKDHINLILEYINTSKFDISVTDYLTNSEMIKNIYKKIEKA